MRFYHTQFRLHLHTHVYPHYTLYIAVPFTHTHIYVPHAFTLPRFDLHTFVYIRILLFAVVGCTVVHLRLLLFGWLRLHILGWLLRLHLHLPTFPTHIYLAGWFTHTVVAHVWLRLLRLFGSYICHIATHLFVCYGWTTRICVYVTFTFAFAFTFIWLFTFTLRCILHFGLRLRILRARVYILRLRLFTFAFVRTFGWLRVWFTVARFGYTHAFAHPRCTFAFFPHFCWFGCVRILRGLRGLGYPDWFPVTVGWLHCVYVYGWIHFTGYPIGYLYPTVVVGLITPVHTVTLLPLHAFCGLVWFYVPLFWFIYTPHVLYFTTRTVTRLFTLVPTLV